MKQILPKSLATLGIILLAFGLWLGLAYPPAELRAPSKAVTTANVKATPQVTPQPKTIVVGIQPLGQVPQQYLTATAEALHDLYGATTRQLAPRDLPQTTWNHAHTRYRAADIVRRLEADKEVGLTHVMGVTEADISTQISLTSDWGVFGLAQRNSSGAVISTFRIKLDNPPPTLFLARLRKVVLHEFGHNLGLDHCTHSPTCLMRSTEGNMQALDTAEAALCDKCAAQISNRTHSSTATTSTTTLTNY